MWHYIVFIARTNQHNPIFHDVNRYLFSHEDGGHFILARLCINNIKIIICL